MKLTDETLTAAMDDAFAPLIALMQTPYAKFSPAPRFDGGQAPTEKAKRPLKADGHAGILALALLNGHRLTVQSAVEWLKPKVSNCPDKRLREARTWLIANQISIITHKLEKCEAWSIENPHGEAARNIKNIMKAR